jgi:hypothetical protein
MSWLLSVLRPFAIADEVEIDEDSSCLGLEL